MVFLCVYCRVFNIKIYDMRDCHCILFAINARQFTYIQPIFILLSKNITFTMYIYIRMKMNKIKEKMLKEKASTSFLLYNSIVNSNNMIWCYYQSIILQQVILMWLAMDFYYWGFIYSFLFFPTNFSLSKIVPYILFVDFIY